MGIFKKNESNEIQLKVTGMTCGHCEMHVAKALENVNGVKSAKADKDQKMAWVQIKGNKEIAILDLVEAVKDAGYQAEIID